MLNFNTNVILEGGTELTEGLAYEGLVSLWKTRHGAIFGHTKLDLDTDGIAPAGVKMDVDHQNETALKYEDGTSLSSFDTPFMVIPLGFQDYLASVGITIALGAIGIMQYKGIAVPFLVADLGPRHKIGEGSAYIREKFGFRVIEDGKIIDCGIDKDPGVEWVIFPNSGNGYGRTLAEITAAATEYAVGL